MIKTVALSSNRGIAMLPPRSTVGHLPLEQGIGVRIPGGQPLAALHPCNDSAHTPSSLQFHPAVTCNPHTQITCVTCSILSVLGQFIYSPNGFLFVSHATEGVSMRV